MRKAYYDDLFKHVIAADEKWVELDLHQVSGETSANKAGSAARPAQVDCRRKLRRLAPAREQPSGRLISDGRFRAEQHALEPRREAGLIGAAPGEPARARSRPRPRRRATPGLLSGRAARSRGISRSLADEQLLVGRAELAGGGVGCGRARTGAGYAAAA